MRVYRSLEEVPQGFGPSIAAIGNFDGVHRGHQAIIGRVIARAREQRAQSIAVIFDPHPVRVLRPEHAPRLITPLPVRLQLLAATGLDATLVLPFTSDFARLSAQDFAEKILAQGIGATEVHEGDNFRFGFQANAGVPELTVLGDQLGFKVLAHPVLSVRGLVASSSQVRECIAAGDMTAARALLGRPFFIRSTPASGRGIGSQLTVPTINLAPYSELLPGHGVYITRILVGGECFDAVTNSGNRPTFGEDSFAVESHLLDFHPIELTSETPIELTFLRRIRAERRFDSPAALREQIMRDVQFARKYFARLRAIENRAGSTVAAALHPSTSL